MTQEQKRLLGEMKNTPYGNALSTFLREHLSDLKDITKASSWEETQGRQHAVKVLTKLFDFIITEDTTPRQKTRYD